MKIFGREPAAWIGLIEAVIALLVITALHWSNGQVGLVMAVVVAGFSVYTAWATHDTMLAVVVGLSKAVFALLIGFGVTLSPELTGALIGLVTVVLGFFNRQQTYPLGDPPQAVAGATPVSNVGVS